MNPNITTAFSKFLLFLPATTELETSDAVTHSTHPGMKLATLVKNPYGES